MSCEWLGALRASPSARKQGGGSEALTAARPGVASRRWVRSFGRTAAARSSPRRGAAHAWSSATSRTKSNPLACGERWRRAHCRAPGGGTPPSETRPALRAARTNANYVPSGDNSDCSTIPHATRRRSRPACVGAPRAGGAMSAPDDHKCLPEATPGLRGDADAGYHGSSAGIP
jgi:hypothetical protein